MVAPVVFDLTVGGVDRTVKAFFDVVVPDDVSPDQRNDPEALAGVAVRMLLPLLWFDSYGLPEP